tara:strand:+ start:947 stop:1420 length:474 start_codon:yes stop_codon:yes gene_type:complete
MRLTIVPEDKVIIIDGDGVHCSHVDLSWIPTDAHVIQWDDTKGHIEHLDKPPTDITELGIYQQAVTDHANEKTLATAAYEAARNHLTEVKDHRNWLLAVSDWTRLDDVTLAADKKTEWQTYRQALRDLPATISADDNLTAKLLADNHSHSGWPTKPS